MKIMQHTSPPALPSSFSPQLSRLLATCMARHASHRPTALQLLSIPLVLTHCADFGLTGLLPANSRKVSPPGRDPSPPQPPPPPSAASRGSALGGAHGGAHPLQMASQHSSCGGIGGGGGGLGNGLGGPRVGSSASAAACYPSTGGRCGGMAHLDDYGAPPPAPTSSPPIEPYGGGRPPPPFALQREGGGAPFQLQQPPTGRASGPGMGVHEYDHSAVGMGGGGMSLGVPSLHRGSSEPPATMGAGGEYDDSPCHDGGGGGLGRQRGHARNRSSGGDIGGAAGGGALGAGGREQPAPGRVCTRITSTGACSESTRGVSWSIKPVCAERGKRTAPMRKSWHALLQPASFDDSSEPSAPAVPASPPRQQQVRGAPFVRAGAGRQGVSHGSSTCGALGRCAAAGQSAGGAPDPPHTPPTNLWAKRRGSDEASPGSMPDNLQLMSLKGHGWEDLQSPLDAFAQKHCPTRSSRHTSSSAASVGSHLSDGRQLIEADGEDSPAWDRPGNSSPLAALLRREFPQQQRHAHASQGVFPTRSLFEDM